MIYNQAIFNTKRWSSSANYLAAQLVALVCKSIKRLEASVY